MNSDHSISSIVCNIQMVFHIRYFVFNCLLVCIILIIDINIIPITQIKKKLIMYIFLFNFFNFLFIHLFSSLKFKVKYAITINTPFIFDVFNVKPGKSITKFYIFFDTFHRSKIYTFTNILSLLITYV